MMPEKIIILTGNDYCHQYFIDHLNANFSISEIYKEAGNFPCPSPHSKEESLAWDWFFKSRNEYENKLINNSGKLTAKNKPRIINLDGNELNSPQTIAKIKKTNPGLIAVFGTSILRKSMLDEFPNRFFNLHIGNPEYYRGSSCNFWPVYQGKLHHLSASVHRIDQDIDTGDILFKQSVTIDTNDNEQTLLFKPLIVGTNLMIKTIKKWQIEPLHSVPQNRCGKLYKKSDFNPQVILRFKQMVESGKIKNYIQDSLAFEV
jgi:methionyl-tRNA formyltransferase